MGWPRRSAPLPANRNTPSSSPICRFGRLTLGSADLAPAGRVARSQISAYTPFAPVILEPVLLSVARIAGATSEGGLPAGSALYWAFPLDCVRAATAARRRLPTTLVITSSLAGWFQVASTQSSSASVQAAIFTPRRR